jgi:hypothetical protein
VFLFTVSVNAAPISITTGAPDGSFDATSEWYLMADDFTLPVDTILTHIGSPGHDYGTWLIFAGEPGLFFPGDLLAYGDIGPLDSQGRFEVAHLLLTGGARYWYGFYHGRLDECPAFAATGSFFDGTSNPGSEIALVVTHSRRNCAGDVLEGWLDAFGAPASFWSREHLPDSFTDLSFTAYGQTVPEPSVSMLVAAGTGALLRRWRSRSRRR